MVTAKEQSEFSREKFSHLFATIICIAIYSVSASMQVRGDFSSPMVGCARAFSKGYEVEVRFGACADLVEGLCLCFRMFFVEYCHPCGLGKKESFLANGCGLSFAPVELMVGIGARVLVISLSVSNLMAERRGLLFCVLNFCGYSIAPYYLNL